MKIGFCLALLSLLLATFSAHAFEANKRTRLSPATQLKVNKAIARSYVQGRHNADQAAKQGLAKLPQSSCGNLGVGNIGQNRALRIDNVTVIRGDVININRNTRCR